MYTSAYTYVLVANPLCYILIHILYASCILILCKYSFTNHGNIPSCLYICISVTACPDRIYMGTRIMSSQYSINEFQTHLMSLTALSPTEYTYGVYKNKPILIMVTPSTEGQGQPPFAC